jgi:hypothetical protein
LSPPLRDALEVAIDVDDAEACEYAASLERRRDPEESRVSCGEW